MINSINKGKLGLLATVAPFAMVLSAGSALAQSLPQAQSNTENQADQGQQLPSPTTGEESGQDVVVTGSILRRTDTATPSPVTTLTAENLDQRGINTTQDAIQQLSSNNGPALSNNFTANGAFAGGASAVSLRGLSTNSTLVLFDGLRAAYYPLADDGSRNFVDLNTIPDDIVDRIEVLRDGASSSYGADAIAGVVNIITKKEFKGVSGRAEAGISQRGFAANQRVSLTAGVGDLDDNGYNAYVSGFYYHQDQVNNRDLKSPFNSSDQRGIGGPNGQAYGFDENGLLANNGTLTAQGDGSFNLGNLYVRPANGTTNVAIPGTRYQLLSGQCNNGTLYTPTAADRTNGQVLNPDGTVKTASLNANVPNTVCREDGQQTYGVTAPQIDRFGVSARFTGRLSDSIEAYLELNFQQSRVQYTGGPPTIRGNAPTGIFYPQFSTSSALSPPRAPGSFVLSLPVYVCPRGTTVACTAANGTLNPNNPFAQANQNALLIGSLPNITTSNETRNRVYRAAAGFSGTVLGDVDFKLDLTAMHSDLRLINNGYVYIQHLLDVVRDGSFNFINPYANSQDSIDYLTPQNVNDDQSDLYQAQLTLGKTLAQLPGGPLQLGVGGSIYYESVNSPSANSDVNGPTQRYFTLNAFGTVGNRTVASAFAELSAPIIDQLEINASARYDHYSSGQHNLSPKVGVTFKPVRQLVLRGTYSKGFRIPSFGEANALPTTGYVSQVAANIPANFRAQYGAACAADATACPSYLTNYSIGLTTLASPNLKPEKSRSFTGGVLFEPIRNVSFTVDYFNIKKTGAITAPSSAPAIAAYYAGQPIPAGYNVIADAPLVDGPPGATPRIAFVESQLINANTIKSEGIDFGANVVHDFGFTKLTSNLDLSLLLNLSTTFPDGTTEKYVGTLGNFNLTAGSGTFKWHGNWQNTLDFGALALTGTVNYTSGYDLSAQDQGTGYKDCGLSPGYLGCKVKAYITADLNASFKVNDKFTFYVNVLNLLDHLPDIDPVTYGAYLYNPVQGGTNIYGRQFRAGAKFNF